MSDSNLIIVNLNHLEFDPSTFTPEVPLPPIVRYMIPASGKSQVHNKKVCVEGDEKKVIKLHAYTHPGHPIPGSGMFKITKLNADQKTKKTTDNDIAIIIKGSQFDAEYEVTGPAILPTPKGPEDDKKPKYTGGKGEFVDLPNTDVYAG
jgi:Contractile injection system spike tip protein